MAGLFVSAAVSIGLPACYHNFPQPAQRRHIRQPQTAEYAPQLQQHFATSRPSFSGLREVFCSYPPAQPVSRTSERCSRHSLRTLADQHPSHAQRDVMEPQGGSGPLVNLSTTSVACLAGMQH
ncbi:hypothetical protein HII31_09043 [Pseudocercospora fuligena]|uniref:Uncharacterized protein n=1 Tax=Pseudocercospora fuligena TaxID=685502 RepID=A0A8H6VIT5_9PEZI|nr:hypothetical protein HII31_09043 [Pseudocercospora fuligena]